MNQTQLLGRLLSSAFNLGDLYEMRLHFADGRTIERVVSSARSRR